MFFGILLMLCTGLCWIGIGIISSYDAAKKINQGLVQFASSLLLTGVSAGVLFFRHQPFFLPLPALLLAVGGVLNYLSFVALCKGMSRMHNGLAWAIMQSSMIFPFLMGMIFFGVEPTWVRVAGLFCVLFSMALSATGTPNIKKTSHIATSKSVFSIWTLVAFLFAGAAQCCCNLPSYLDNVAELTNISKTFWNQLGGSLLILPFCASNCTQKTLWKKTLMPIFSLFAITLTVQYFFFFKGLDLLAASGAGSVGYPVAIGSCVAGFSLYSIFILKEKTTGKNRFALGLILAGIVLLSLNLAA